jgi:hypothetical protein
MFLGSASASRVVAVLAPSTETSQIYGQAVDTTASTQESRFEPDNLPLPGPFVATCD